MFTEKNKKINRLTLKHVLFLITYTIALIWIMLHLNHWRIHCRDILRMHRKRLPV